MSKQIRFTFNVHPKAKQSTKFGRGRAYTPDKISGYQEGIKYDALAQARQKGFTKLLGAVRMQVVYTFQATKAIHRKYGMIGSRIIYKTTKPDLTDNLNKCIADALEGIAYEQDQQIADFQATKIYGDKPMIEVIISNLN